MTILWDGYMEYIVYHHSNTSTFQGSCWSKSRVSTQWNTPPETNSTWKWIVGILLSFWDGLFSGSMLIFRGVVASTSTWTSEVPQANPSDWRSSEGFAHTSSAGKQPPVRKILLESWSMMEAVWSFYMFLQLQDLDFLKWSFLTKMVMTFVHVFCPASPLPLAHKNPTGRDVHLKKRLNLPSSSVMAIWVMRLFLRPEVDHSRRKTCMRSSNHFTPPKNTVGVDFLWQNPSDEFFFPLPALNVPSFADYFDRVFGLLPPTILF